MLYNKLSKLFENKRGSTLKKDWKIGKGRPKSNSKQGIKGPRGITWISADNDNSEFCIRLFEEFHSYF